MKNRDFPLEATHLRDTLYAVRPAGMLGSCGFIDGIGWNVAYVRATDSIAAVRKARNVYPHMSIRCN